MTRTLYDTACAIEPIGEQTPDFAVGFYRARYPLERVEFGTWFDSLADALSETL